MHHRIESARAVGYMVLKARFADGSTRLYDVSGLESEIPAFANLREGDGFAENLRVSAGGYGIVWNEKLDLSAEEIWRNGNAAD